MVDILKFNDYKKNEDEPKLGCLMLYFAFSDWSQFIRKMIKEEDIYSNEDEDTDKVNNYGFENEAHCTVLFGFHHYEGIVQKIKEYLPELEYIDDIMRGNITLFEQEKYDVIKFDLHSEKLKDLNEKFKENFEYTNEFLDYKPHMTIAYVKKGEGAKYFKENLKQIPLFPNKFVYSDHEHNQTEF